MEIDKADFERIAETINSDTSPVGIDAKKTHVLILHMLDNMQKQLDRMEQRINETGTNA